MYLWNTKALAAELRAGTVTEYERMKYWLLTSTVTVVTGELSFYLYNSLPEPITLVPIVGSGLYIIVTIVGIYATYLVNRSGDDRDFIGRSICISVPIGVRLLAVMAVVQVTYFSLGTILGGDAFEQFTSQTNWVDAGFVALLEIVFFWRLCHHLRWISAPRQAA